MDVRDWVSKTYVTELRIFMYLAILYLRISIRLILLVILFIFYLSHMYNVVILVILFWAIQFTYKIWSNKFKLKRNESTFVLENNFLLIIFLCGGEDYTMILVTLILIDSTLCLTKSHVHLGYHRYLRNIFILKIFIILIILNNLIASLNWNNPWTVR